MPDLPSSDRRRRAVPEPGAPGPRAQGAAGPEPRQAPLLPPPMRVVVQGGWGSVRDDLAGETPHSALLRRWARGLSRP